LYHYDHGTEGYHKTEQLSFGLITALCIHTTADGNLIMRRYPSNGFLLFGIHPMDFVFPFCLQNTASGLMLMQDDPACYRGQCITKRPEAVLRKQNGKTKSIGWIPKSSGLMAVIRCAHTRAEGFSTFVTCYEQANNYVQLWLPCTTAVVGKTYCTIRTG
jgi:hypothetical protein